MIHSNGRLLALEDDLELTDTGTCTCSIFYTEIYKPHTFRTFKVGLPGANTYSTLALSRWCLNK